MPTSFTTEERSLLSRHVTNLDDNVYAIMNLPEEVIAVVFAYVSRSPASFRTNLLKLLKEGDVAVSQNTGDGSAPNEAASSLPDYEAAQSKAKSFHERWVIGYGHSSVAEHAVVHIGVERISRLASARLELANRFLSFTEYSQRYQMPIRGAYVTPTRLLQPDCEDLLQEYESVQNRAYDTYLHLKEGLYRWLQSESPELPGESERSRSLRLEKLAFEDARYALPLAVETSLGMTGNGRALRDAIVNLLSDPYEETSELALALRHEAGKLLPALLKYADPNSFRINSSKALCRHASVLAKQDHDVPPTVQLISWPEEALDKLVMLLLYPHITRSGDELLAEVRAWPAEKKLEIYRTAVHELGPHDPPHDAWHGLVYEADLCLSEAAWHQLLRHTRGCRFFEQSPSVHHGMVIPPNIRDAGLSRHLSDICDQLESIHHVFVQRGLHSEADYLVANAHRRQVRMQFDLAQLFHLVQLRGQPDAQWDIRAVVLELLELVREQHPFLREPQLPR